MRLLLLTAVLCLLFLTWTAVLPAPAGYVLLLSALVWILYLEREHYRRAEALKARRSFHKARWAVYVNHLSGLPLPADTTAILLFSGQDFILETENESWQLPFEQVHKLLLATGEQLRKKSDQQICRQLEVEDCIFFALRERIRRREKNSGRRGFLLLAGQEHTVWVFVVSGRWQALANLFKVTGMNEKTLFLLE